MPRSDEDLVLSVRLGYFAAELTGSRVSGWPAAAAYGDVVRERLRERGYPETESGILAASGLEAVYAR